MYSGYHNTTGVLPLVGHKSILGPLIPLLWTSDEVSFAFQNQSGQPFIFCLNFSWTHVYERGATDASVLDFLITSPLELKSS